MASVMASTATSNALPHSTALSWEPGGFANRAIRRVSVAMTQRAPYPLHKEYTSNYRGLNIMIQVIFLN